MSTPTNYKTPAANDPAPSSPAYNGGMDQVGGGQAGLLYTLSNELIAIYNHLQMLNNEMAQAETKVAGEMITAGAESQRAAAAHEAKAITAQAAGTIVGGVVSVGTSAVSLIGNSRSTSEIETQEGHLNGLNNMNRFTQKASMGPQDLLVSRGGAGRMPTNDDVDLRRTELRNGIYRSDHFANEEASDPEFMKTVNHNAIHSMNAADRETFRSELQTKISDQNKIIGNIHSGMLNNSNRITSLGDMVKGLGAGTAQGFQSHSTKEAGNNRAAQQVANGVSQMAMATGDTARQSVSKYQDAISGVIAQAEKGANAYPRV